MISFCISLVALVLGYVFYGAVVERVFGVEPDRPTPCFTKQDGVDYIPMPTWKVFLIQFLNIAGTGPIFGAIMGILFGPAAYLWIVLGCIFAGATHDYMSGMISLRKGGISIPEFVGDELGSGIRLLMRVFSMVLLVLVAAVFVATPANLLSNMTSGWGACGTVFFWSALVFFYYILATLLPVSALIGRIYPLFGLAMLIMAVGLAIGIFTHDGWMPEFTDPLTGHHPKGLPVFPMLCITIACGAISGFHGTQSPMMARCLKSERMGRRVFYGAMIAEGLVALIWAAASIKYAGGYQQLADMGNPAVVVSTLCSSWMGRIGAILAILGVVAAPITSGDTALRSARLMAADFLHFPQNKLWKRLALSLPIFVVCGMLLFIDFNVLWRYFAWSNQTLAFMTLWAVSVWLARKGRCFWITLLPAMFMTVVCTSYILVAPEGFQLPLCVGIVSGLVFMCLLTALFGYWLVRRRSNGGRS
ncbi:MAG: carbon starvation CstA family protein [Bacteroidaceae bacterium]|nr:carbon starvation CstA family protein [Prevotellaceae bacterium]MDY5599070.1 carbon starvation CstA family protein [Bacteroidaceae bacterium]